MSSSLSRQINEISLICLVLETMDTRKSDVFAGSSVQGFIEKHHGRNIERDIEVWIFDFLSKLGSELLTEVEIITSVEGLVHHARTDLTNDFIIEIIGKHALKHAIQICLGIIRDLRRNFANRPNMGNSDDKSTCHGHLVSRSTKVRTKYFPRDVDRGNFLIFIADSTHVVDDVEERLAEQVHIGSWFVPFISKNNIFLHFIAPYGMFSSLSEYSLSIQPKGVMKQ